MFIYETITRTHVGEVRFLDTVEGIFVVTFSSPWSSKQMCDRREEREVSGTLNPSSFGSILTSGG